LSESEYEEIAKINNQYYDEESIIYTIGKVKETNNEKGNYKGIYSNGIYWKWWIF